MGPVSLKAFINAAIWIFNTYFLPIIGMVAVGVLIYGGIMRMFAGGNSQNVARANAAIFWGIVGIIVAIFGVFIVRFFLKGVLNVNI